MNSRNVSEKRLKNLAHRFRAAGIHLLVSAVVVATVAFIAFSWWYPAPFAAISGGFALLFLIGGVDIVSAPMLTAVAASPDKPRKVFRRDLMIIGMLQAMAIGYGVFTLAVARPVYLVFSVDHFQVVTAADLKTINLDEAPTAFRNLYWTGPRTIGARKPVEAAGLFESIQLALAGYDLPLQPKRWVGYDEVRHDASAAARPIELLTARYPEVAAPLAVIASQCGQPLSTMRFLPLQAHKENWVAVISTGNANIVGYLHVEGFF